MRIIIGTESFSPNISGVAIVVELLAKNLAKKGHEVCVVAPSRDYGTRWDRSFEEFPVLRIRSFPNPFRTGFRIALMPQEEIYRAAREFGPDIVHLHDPASISASLRKAGKKIGVPVVVTNHFSLDYALSYVRYLSPLHPQMRALLTRYLVRFYNQCDYVLCPTQTVKRELESWGVATQIEAVSNGVDLERFFAYSSPAAVRAKYHLPPDPIVLYVGRVDKDKSLEVLIRAIPRVIKESSAHFVIVGNGDELSKLKAMAEKLGVGRRVSFLGWIDHESPDLCRLYQIASVFAIPSTIETQSIVTLEALASGLPVVAADGGALPELVEDGGNGYLFHPRDSEGLGGGIVNILKGDNVARQMRRKSLEIVSRHHISESFARVESIYEEVRQAAT